MESLSNLTLLLEFVALSDAYFTDYYPYITIYLPCKHSSTEFQ